MQARTRIAPSPTGEFHIGSLRTALYNWALAKNTGGKFIIRIEDTDRSRFVEGSTDRALEVIKDYNLHWDEGPDGGPHPPYLQSERLDIYNKYKDELIARDAAYYCFCTQERLGKMREEQRAAGIASTKYDRHCANLSKDEISTELKKGTPYVVRLRVPDNRVISFVDTVYGTIEINSAELDDQILIKSDGFPTYHFAVVIDDHLMGVTHILRGNEWLPSTPKHILLYESFGWKIPIYAHLPLLKEAGETKKLSKRHGPVSAREFLSDGYLPEAVLNYLMLLGWNPGTEREFFTLDEFAGEFSLDRLHKTDLVVFDRMKLLWMNSQYIQKSQVSELNIKIFDYYKGKYDKDMIEQIIPLVQNRIKTLREFEHLAEFFFHEPDVDQSLFGKNYEGHLKIAGDTLNNIPLDQFNHEKISERLIQAVGDNNFRTGDFFMDLRIAVTGKKVTPPFAESVVILGKEETMSRLRKALK